MPPQNVKWNELWLSGKDANGVLIRKWASKHDDQHFWCQICNKSLKFISGKQALINHSKMESHKSLSDTVYSQKQSRLVVSSSASSAPKSGSSTSSSPPIIVLDAALEEKALSAEAKWLFKIARDDITLRSCDNTQELFSSMFSDSEIAKKFTMSRTKASYCITDALSPLLLKKLIEDLSKSDSAFTLLFDETTTLQNRKQMDILLRFFLCLLVQQRPNTYAH